MDGDGRSIQKVLSLINDNLGVFVLLIVLVAFSAFFSASETAVSVSNKIKLKSLSEKGNKKAATLLSLSDNFENTLSAILFGNNLVNILIGSITTILALNLKIDETVMTLCVTGIVILFGEVTPKALAKAQADSAALGMAPFLSFLCAILRPFSAVFSLISKAVTKLFAPKDRVSVTEDDLYDIIEDIDESGADRDEVNLLYSAFEFESVKVGDIYTEKSNVVSIDIDDCGSEKLLKIIKNNLYSRMPVFKGDEQNIIGILRVRTYLSESAFYGMTDIENMLDKPMFTSVDTPADDLLRNMQDDKHHLAVVLDRKDRYVGIITLEDLLEELVGEIFDESDVVEDKFKVLSDGRFEISPDLSVVSAFELMEYDNFDRDEVGHETLLAWTDKLNGGRMRRNDTVDYMQLHITAGKMHHGRPEKFYIAVRADKKEDGVC